MTQGRRWALGYGEGIRGDGLWAMGYGLWAMGYGLCINMAGVLGVITRLRNPLALLDKCHVTHYI